MDSSANGFVNDALNGGNCSEIIPHSRPLALSVSPCQKFFDLCRQNKFALAFKFSPAHRALVAERDKMRAFQNRVWTVRSTLSCGQIKKELRI